METPPSDIFRRRPGWSSGKLTIGSNHALAGVEERFFPILISKNMIRLQRKKKKKFEIGKIKHTHTKQKPEERIM